MEKMVANRLTHSFNNNFYVQILLSYFKQIYDRCAPCIQYHYLRHPDQVLSIQTVSLHILKDTFNFIVSIKIAVITT